MIRVHVVEDHLFEQIEKFNGIGCFVEDFIEQTNQFKMLNKKAGKSRDSNNLAYIIFTNKWISINDDVKKLLKLNIIQEETGKLQQTYLLHKSN